MPARKDATRRQGRGTRDAGNVVELRPVDRIPAPPHWPGKKLLAETVKSWEVFWGSGLARMVEAADMPAVRRLWRMYDERERFDRVFSKEPFVEGSTGQIVAHPAARVIASLDERIAKLEPRFGLTPKGRLELGVAFGAAAKSLEDLNADFDDDETGEGEDSGGDPRRRVLDA